MKQLYTCHNGMAGYLMDFGFGGFIGYGKGVSVGLVMEELDRWKINSSMKMLWTRKVLNL